MVRRPIQETQMLLLGILTSCLVVTIVIYMATVSTATAAATASNVTTADTQLKTYTDPGGFFTLQYPANWTAEYKQPVTKFDKPKVQFEPFGGGSIVTIEAKPSLFGTPEEFRNTLSLAASYLSASDPALTIFGQGSGVYSIAGYDAFAFTFRNDHNPARPLNGMMLVSRIGYEEMSITFNADLDEFDKQMPAVQKMIDSIKITGIR